MSYPTKAQIRRAKAEIAEEDRKDRDRLGAREYIAAMDENARRRNLPPEHTDHICGMRCDGQDGANSHCARLRAKLFGVKK